MDVHQEPDVPCVSRLDVCNIRLVEVHRCSNSVLLEKSKECEEEQMTKDSMHVMSID